MWFPLMHPATGDLDHNPSMCPDWESNRQPFGWQAGAQSTESHQPGLHIFLKVTSLALTGVAQLVRHCPAKWKVPSSISGQGTCPGLQVQIPVGTQARDNQLMFLSLPLSLKKKKKYNDSVMLVLQLKKVTMGGTLWAVIRIPSTEFTILKNLCKVKIQGNMLL